MDKTNLFLLCFTAVFGVGIIRCKAATYLVGDTSGWDISTNLNSWATDKTFSVGDVLVFQYSSTYSVCEVTKDNFGKCNTTHALETYSSGNTTVTLSKPGDRYFICGNRLYCLAGMKLHVYVHGDSSAAPISSPQAQPSGGGAAGMPQPSSKNNNPAVAVPSSGEGFALGDGGIIAIVSMVFGLCNVIWNV